MKISRVILLVITAGLFPWLSAAERRPLEKPEYDTSLGDTSRDIEIRDTEIGRYVFRDSEATVTFDASKGRYDFRFKDEEGTWREAYWVPYSNIDVTLAANVSLSEEGRFEYHYGADVLPTSVRHLTAITLEILSDVSEIRDLGKLGSPERIRRMEAGEWVGKELSRDWGRRLWRWWRFTANLSREEQYTSGSLSLVSQGLPTPMPCWIQGDGSGLFSEHEPRLSLSRFHGAGQGILKDAAKGLTVAPGLETVELPALREYIDVSIAQGWLEEGDYREKLRALLDKALGQHKTGEVDAVLTSLEEIQKLVGEVYAEEGSPVLSEAYALLHFNIDYLLENYKEDLDRVEE